MCAKRSFEGQSVHVQRSRCRTGDLHYVRFFELLLYMDFSTACSMYLFHSGASMRSLWASHVSISFLIFSCLAVSLLWNRAMKYFWNCASVKGSMSSRCLTSSFAYHMPICQLNFISAWDVRQLWDLRLKPFESKLFQSLRTTTFRQIRLRTLFMADG